MKSRKILSVCLVSVLLFAGCTSAQFVTVLNEIAPAVLTVLQIVALVGGTPVNASLTSKVSADTAALAKLYTDFESAATASQPGIAAQINAEFTVLNADLSQVFQIAQVSNPQTQAKITALIGLIQTAVTIAEAAIPQPTPAVTAKAAPLSLDAPGMVSSFNKILTAKTGVVKLDAATPKMQIHIHSKMVRVVTFGYAK